MPADTTPPEEGGLRAALRVLLELERVVTEVCLDVFEGPGELSAEQIANMIANACGPLSVPILEDVRAALAAPPQGGPTHAPAAWKMTCGCGRMALKPDRETLEAMQTLPDACEGPFEITPLYDTPPASAEPQFEIKYHPGDEDYIAGLSGVVALPDYMDRSLADFARALRVLLEGEQAKPNPDNALIAVLCDAARLGWENIRMARKPLPPPASDGLRIAARAVVALGVRTGDSANDAPLAKAINDLQRALSAAHPPTDPGEAGERIRATLEAEGVPMCPSGRSTECECLACRLVDELSAHAGEASDGAVHECKIVNHSLICGAPQCCDVCCREAAAQAGLPTFRVNTPTAYNPNAAPPTAPIELGDGEGR